MSNTVIQLLILYKSPKYYLDKIRFEIVWKMPKSIEFVIIFCVCERENTFYNWNSV